MIHNRDVKTEVNSSNDNIESNSIIIKNSQISEDFKFKNNSQVKNENL
jgi:hypothetical protein